MRHRFVICRSPKEDFCGLLLRKLLLVSSSSQVVNSPAAHVPQSARKLGIVSTGGGERELYHSFVNAGRRAKETTPFFLPTVVADGSYQLLRASCCNSA